MSEQQDPEMLVNKLYAYRDNFIENVGIENVSRKTEMVKTEMEKTLESIKTMEKSCPKTTFFFYIGKTLNVMPDYSKDCEEYLSKVVKRDPSHVEAWNMLGETFWKKGEVTAAKDCFEGALKRKKDEASLRSLSMVLRQIKSEKPSDQRNNVLLSVEHAKAAVELDPTNGKSWYILGNAYLSLFFVSEQHSKVLLMSLNAYSQAQKVDKTSVYNPDLHFNRAVACRYEQNYKLALEGFEKASVLDPLMSEPKERIVELCKYLDKVSEFVEKKGKLKPKRLQNLIKSMKEKDLGPYCGGSYTSGEKTVPLVSTMLSELKEGVNKEKSRSILSEFLTHCKKLNTLAPGEHLLKSLNVDRDRLKLTSIAVQTDQKSHMSWKFKAGNSESVLLGRVVCNFADLTLVPFTLAMVDSTGACCSVTIYNLAQGRGMIIGDTVAIPEPYITKHDLKWNVDGRDKQWNFSNVRVDNPVVLVVNGKKLTNEYCGFTKASMTLGN